MANKSFTAFLHNVAMRLINYTSTYYAEMGAVIPYNSGEVELFTAANPGKVGIDQTTPGTTNGVAITAAGKTIQRAVISTATSGDNTLVAAVAGQKIKVLALVLIVSGDVDVRLESGAGGTALTGVMSLAADGNGFVLPPAVPGLHWLETAAGALLNLELSATVQVSGFLVYYAEA